MAALAPDFLRLQPQRDGLPDCSVAAIATLTGVDYNTVLIACLKLRRDALIKGLTVEQIMRVITRLGFTVRRWRRGTYDVDQHTGILHVFRGKSANQCEESHVVILWHGRILDAGTDLWLSLDDYLGARGTRAGALITLDS